MQGFPVFLLIIDAEVSKASGSCHCNEIPWEKLKQLGKSGRLWRSLSLLELGIPLNLTANKVELKGHLRRWCNAASSRSKTAAKQPRQGNSSGRSIPNVEGSTFSNDGLDFDGDPLSGGDGLELWKIWDYEIDGLHSGVTNRNVTIPQIDSIEGLSRCHLPLFVVESLLTEKSELPGNSMIVDLSTTTLFLVGSPSYTSNLIPFQAEHVYRVVPRAFPLASSNGEGFKKFVLYMCSRCTAQLSLPPVVLCVDCQCLLNQA